MALLETLQLEHIPSTHSIHIALYRNLKNALFLHQQLLAGNTDFEYALIDASVIVSRVHALAAAYRAINDALSNRLRSRNVHSEIVFSLSPNNNIADSFRRFGITPTTRDLLIIKVSPPSSSSSICEHLTSSVEGEPVTFSDEALIEMCDLGKVRKIYKLNNSRVGGGKKDVVNGVQGLSINGQEKRDEKNELEVMILGAMALRGATN